MGWWKMNWDGLNEASAVSGERAHDAVLASLLEMVVWARRVRRSDVQLVSVSSHVRFRCFLLDGGHGVFGTQIAPTGCCTMRSR